VVLAIVLLPLVVLPLVAAFRVPRERRMPFALLALVAGYLVFASGGPPGNYRFRAPVVPFLVLMGAYSILRSEATKNQPRRRATGGE